MTSDLPTLALNIGSPTAAGNAGYLIVGSGLIGTGKVAPDPYYAPYAGLRAFSTRRGSDDPTDPMFRAQAGTASVKVNNRDRSFDPSSNPDIVPQQAMQLTATWNATTYEVFTGHIDEIGLTYPAQAKDAVTNLNCVDGMQRLAAVNVIDSLPEQSTGDRITHIADLAEWPRTLRTVDTGLSRMPAAVGSSSGLQTIFEASDSELGDFYIDDDRTLVFRDRNKLIGESRSATSQATFGDGGGSELSYADIQLTYDTRRIRNDVKVIFNEAGDYAYASDAASINRYGRQSFQLQVLLTDPSIARNLAIFLVNLWKTPLIRVDSLTIKPRRNPSVLWPQALGRKIGDRITIKTTPPGGGSRITRDCFLRGIGHDYDASNNDWTTRFACQDASGFSGYFIIGTSTIGSADKIWF